VVLAGGGTAGHIEPALAVADAVRRRRPDARVVALGTPRGLEGTLVPARGYPLELIPPAPMPRRLGPEVVALPARLVAAVRATSSVLRRWGADVVVGFGGYVALPAYLAARLPGRRVPVVVHEANARAGLANRVGARLAARVAAAVDGSGLPGAQVVGVPLRESITTLDRAARRSAAREYFGLARDAPTLLVTGGSQGARSINEAVAGCAAELASAGVGVLHAYGTRNTVEVPDALGGARYVALPYLERMDLAYAAADVVLCRSGMMTVSEVSAVGLPAVFVPLPHGNGEQAANAAPLVSAGGAIMLPDVALTPAAISARVIPLLTEPQRREAMTAAALRASHPDADEVLAKMVLEVIGG
jgi:UDP-N-acetylglucosamine--N-acetylmuramyl-(pentapeptide) pyrophosphoryl-undecaprenol N-acetylglucosamine transferase